MRRRRRAELLQRADTEKYCSKQGTMRWCTPAERAPRQYQNLLNQCEGHATSLSVLATVNLASPALPAPPRCLEANALSSNVRYVRQCLWTNIQNMSGHVCLGNESRHPCRGKPSRAAGYRSSRCKCSTPSAPTVAADGKHDCNAAGGGSRAGIKSVVYSLLLTIFNHSNAA